MRTRKELRLTMMPGQAIDLVRTLVLGVLGPALLLGGCASFDRQPFEAAQIEAAHAPDSPKIRHWANSPDLLTQISIAPPPPQAVNQYPGNATRMGGMAVPEYGSNRPPPAPAIRPLAPAGFCD